MKRWRNFNPRIYYYALPSPVALERFPDISSVEGIAFNCARFIRAMVRRGYMGFGNCNATVEHFFWHYPCEYYYSSVGLSLDLT
jgi:hypothetical protein